MAQVIVFSCFILGFFFFQFCVSNSYVRFQKQYLDGIFIIRTSYNIFTYQFYSNY